MTTNRLADTLKSKKIATTPEPLSAFEGKELTLRAYQTMPGTYGDYVLMDVVDENGENHILSTGGMTIIRVLQALDPEVDFPTQVKFERVATGGGRKVWSIT